MAERSQSTKDLLTLYKAIAIDLPIAITKTSLGVAKDHEVEAAAWKAYDAWVNLASHSTDALYRNPFFGDTVGRGMYGTLQTQRLAGAVSEAVFAVMRSITGLVGASELQAVRTELHDLRQELRNLIAALPGRSALAEQAGTERDEAQEGEESINALDGGRSQFDAANGAVRTA